MNNTNVVPQADKTFEEVGVVFTEGSGCHTCRDNSCANTVPLKANGEEYNVHINK
jgi:hypothetical protein